MRRLFFVLVCGLFALTLPAAAATGKIMKVLPQFLDAKGRTALSPSLYERDAYQAYLRGNPDKCSGLVFKTEWKSKGAVTPKLRIELRGVPEGEKAKELTLEKSVSRRGSFGQWTSLPFEGKSFVDFGKVTAWRATLWDGDQLLAEQKSFLWQ
jgi:hypothetical protein